MRLESTREQNIDDIFGGYVQQPVPGKVQVSSLTNNQQNLAKLAYNVYNSNLKVKTVSW